MKFSVPNPSGPAVIEVDERSTVCVMEGCGGPIVRHSLGAAQSVDRCLRCFRRYQLRPVRTNGDGKTRLRRIVDDFVSWREDASD
ncbi:MAG: hypothetical protein WEC75_12075 [Dehalococcoidia bacterium]